MKRLRKKRTARVQITKRPFGKSQFDVDGSWTGTAMHGDAVQDVDDL